MIIIKLICEITIILLLSVRQFLRECLYLLMHVMINIVVTVHRAYHQFWITKGSSLNVASDIGVLMKNIPRLKKPLNHLVVLADTESHCMSDLARVVTWSRVARVSYVSFHDVTGNLKQDEEKLLIEVERHGKEVISCIKFQCDNLTGLSQTIVTVLGSQDGRVKISGVIRRIALERVLSTQNYKEITVQELNSRLSLVYSFPDPDVIFYTGPSCRTHGCLPWQLRLTEFIRVSLDHSFTVDNFVGALYKYNKCDQRFGK